MRRAQISFENNGTDSYRESSDENESSVYLESEEENEPRKDNNTRMEPGPSLVKRNSKNDSKANGKPRKLVKISENIEGNEKISMEKTGFKGRPSGKLTQIKDSPKLLELTEYEEDFLGILRCLVEENDKRAEKNEELNQNDDLLKSFLKAVESNSFDGTTVFKSKIGKILSSMKEVSKNLHDREISLVDSFGGLSHREEGFGRLVQAENRSH